MVPSRLGNSLGTSARLMYAGRPAPAEPPPMKHRPPNPAHAILAATMLCLVSPMRADEPASLVFKPNDKVAFLGDSITNYGWRHPTGYVRLVAKALELQGVPIEVVPAGISGHRSNDMLARLEADVLDHQPAWMVLSCGVNDVWKGEEGVPLEDYRKNMTAIVDRALAAGIQVVVLTATMVGEDPDNEENRQLAGYNSFLRDLAAAKGCLLIDVNAVMQERVGTYREGLGGAEPRDILTRDGVHPNGLGDMMIASAVLRGLGFTDSMIASVEPAWLGMDTRIGHLGAMSTRGHANPSVWERDRSKLGQMFTIKFRDQLWIESLDEAGRRELQRQVDELTDPVMARVVRERREGDGRQ